MVRHRVARYTEYHGGHHDRRYATRSRALSPKTCSSPPQYVLVSSAHVSQGGFCCQEKNLVFFGRKIYSLILPRLLGVASFHPILVDSVYCLVHDDFWCVSEEIP